MICTVVCSVPPNNSSRESLAAAARSLSQTHDSAAVGTCRKGWAEPPCAAPPPGPRLAVLLRVCNRYYHTYRLHTQNQLVWAASFDGQLGLLGGISTIEVCSCLHLKCLSILYWVLGLHMIIFGVSLFPPRVLHGFVHPGKKSAHLGWMQEQTSFILASRTGSLILGPKFCPFQ